MSAHSVFSPSASHRILNCPPSLMLCAKIAEQPSLYAAEGTCAHELCAYLVERALGRNVKDPTENLDYYNAEMQSCAEGYAAFVMEEYERAKAACPDAQVFVEQRVDISRWVPGCGGTADCVILSDGVVEVIDYKHGVGVPVSASSEEFGGNPQLMCYSMSKVDLLAWADEVLAPVAKLALEGEGDFKAGEHCRFCKVKATCRKRAEYNLELAKYDFEMPAELKDYEIDAILMAVDRLTEWASDVKEYALAEALRGKEYEHFKVVEGRSVRKYTSEDDVVKAVTDAGYDPYEKKLLGITAMTSLLGKKKFEEILGALTFKPRGKPALVPKSDKRPAMKSTAKEDFSE